MPTCLHCEKNDESANIWKRKDSTRYTWSAREQCRVEQHFEQENETV